jgi:nucleosome binding factor SPN SPT16 subunit
MDVGEGETESEASTSGILAAAKAWQQSRAEGDEGETSEQFSADLDRDDESDDDSEDDEVNNYLIMLDQRVITILFSCRNLKTNPGKKNKKWKL